MWEVYGLGDYTPPAYLELHCYEDEVRRACDDALFYIDIGNLEAAGYSYEDEFDDESRKVGYLAQVERLKAGECDYFVTCLYYPSEADHYKVFGAPLPKTKTLFDIRNQAGISPYYAVIYVREERPLMADVLAEWFERLSPALFGDHSAY